MYEKQEESRASNPYMSRFWDNWASAYRAVHAFGVVIMLLIVLVFVWWTDPGELVARQRETGTVVEVHETDRAWTTALIRLPDGSQARLIVQPPKPAPGDDIPLVVEIYADGTRHLSLDLDRWREY
jgi:hypothetical protein